MLSKMAMAGRMLDRILTVVMILLMAALAALVIAAVVFRYTGYSLRFYDELAAMLLAWITYYGAALAAIRGQHMATTGIVNRMPQALRVGVCLLSRTLTISFLVILAVMGFRVLDAISGMHMNSLPIMPRSIAQHVVPVGACLYILAELLRLPVSIEEARQGRISASEG
ncbi:TRAP-type C4-dicarboxylate transport system permease small subunit [Natronocella acetinitrilica]|uniref:TRAP transporter small permease protein n=1 Tax=Natronocella acetinitrilica TaxID=414046 RepID=A0AAE3G8G9_9GAMM|nr:TRAP transporter small permease subunit [Natronocella acetinitrilica]MCP1675747.1 TRAP-type C4-dicarboxylate transport system permease small subunit [Natronocella acetinitrilica]